MRVTLVNYVLYYFSCFDLISRLMRVLEKLYGTNENEHHYLEEQYDKKKIEIEISKLKDMSKVELR